MRMIIKKSIPLLFVLLAFTLTYMRKYKQLPEQ